MIDWTTINDVGTDLKSRTTEHEDTWKDTYVDTYKGTYKDTFKGTYKDAYVNIIPS